MRRAARTAQACYRQRSYGSEPADGRGTYTEPCGLEGDIDGERGCRADHRRDAPMVSVSPCRRRSEAMGRTGGCTDTAIERWQCGTERSLQSSTTGANRDGWQG